MPISLDGLLDEQPLEALEGMLADLVTQRGRLEARIEIVREAIEKKTPPPRRAPGRAGQVSRRRIYKLLLATPELGSFTAPEVRDLLTKQGIEVSASSVRNALNRLWKPDKLLHSKGDGTYVLVARMNPLELAAYEIEMAAAAQEAEREKARRAEVIAAWNARRIGQGPTPVQGSPSVQSRESNS